MLIPKRIYNNRENIKSRFVFLPIVRRLLNNNKIPLPLFLFALDLINFNLYLN